MYTETAAQKELLRSRALKRRLAMTEVAVGLQSESIVRRLLAQPEIVEANSVALFWPMIARREVDLRQLDTLLRARSTELYYPFMTSSRDGGFRSVPDPSELRLASHGFCEPSASQPVATKVDVIIVPALLVTRAGERLGYGAGFYDRTLRAGGSFADSFSVAVAFAEELVEELPTDEFDVRCRLVVTG